MGKVMDKGWSTSADEIAQPNSIVMGSNLRENSDKRLEAAETVQSKEQQQPKKELD